MRELRFVVWSCDRQTFLASEKLMETKDRSTRVKAPTHSSSDVAAKSGDSTSRVNDEMFANLKGRSKSDGRKRRDQKLLHCKREIYMATMNVRSIRLQQSKGRTG